MSFLPKGYKSAQDVWVESSREARKCLERSNNGDSSVHLVRDSKELREGKCQEIPLPPSKIHPHSLQESEEMLGRSLAGAISLSNAGTQPALHS